MDGTRFAVVSVAFALLTPTTYAEFVPVSLAPVANQINNRIQNVPEGLQTLGGVPFDLMPQSANNAWAAEVGSPLGVPTLRTMVLPVSVYGVNTVDTLINTSWGVDGSSTVSLIFTGTGGAFHTVDLVAGVDIRDWLHNTSDPYVNTINGTSTVEVFQGPPNAAGGPYGRIDKQSIWLPPIFASETLTAIILNDNGVNGNNDSAYSHSVGAQRSFVFGITLTTVPEPASLNSVLAGTLVAALVLNRRRNLLHM